MTIDQLRQKHPVFHYKDFSIKQAGRELFIGFNFFLEPDIQFLPTVTIPVDGDIDVETIKPLVFHLGLVEMISYWKAACSPKIIIEAGSLTEQQVSSWHDLFLHGLGEFFYTNNIDFTQPNFLTIKSLGARGGTPFRSAATALATKTLWAPSESGPWRHENQGVPPKARSHDLVMVGGGKDSAVTLEILKRLNQLNNILLLNPTPAALQVSRVAGFENPIIVKRTIDATLLKLNDEGYLNGHTPFSAYLAFLSILVGKIYGFKEVIASNEESANMGNVTFHGQEINHQYSKSFRFEKMFREYTKKYLLDMPGYFSFLRPLSELQIAQLFSTMPKYHTVFKSCNVGSRLVGDPPERRERWCGACAKCAFTYLVLAPFLSPKAMMQIFGEDYFNKPDLRDHIYDLVGLGNHKPFDCVGTPEETKQAIALTIAKYKEENIELPELLRDLKEKLNITHTMNLLSIQEGIKSHWNSNNFLPKDYAHVLQEAFKQ